MESDATPDGSVDPDCTPREGAGNAWPPRPSRTIACGRNASKVGYENGTVEPAGLRGFSSTEFGGGSALPVLGPRITVRRLMVAIALAGFAFGSAVEITRLSNHWRFCRGRAELFADCARNSHEHWQEACEQLARTEAFIRWLNDLGPRPRSINSLLAWADSPDLARRCLRSYVIHNIHTDERQDLARSLRHQTPQVPIQGGETSLSPAVVAGWLRFKIINQKAVVRQRAIWTHDYSLMVLAYRRVMARPWEPLPEEIIQP